MSFVIVNTSASAAVATNGTFTATIPTQALVGAIKNRGGHIMTIHSMGALFSFPKDFSVTYSAAVATITYLGTTTIPAGSAIQIQFELDGDDINNPYHQVASNQADKVAGSFRGCFGQVFRVDFGAPLNANTTLVLATTAVGDALLHTLAAPVVLDVPRILQYVSSSAGDITQTVTVRGFDEYGNAMTEVSGTITGVTPVLGKKAFKSVVSYQSSVAFAGNLSIGSGLAYGLPYYLAKQTGTGIGSILKESQDGATPTPGVPVGGDLSLATGTTGDVRGTIIPNVTPDGVKVYSAYMFVADTSFLGVPQYSA